MKILVPVKRVIDYHVNVKVKPDGSDVEKDNVNMSMNPFDEIATEAAIVLKEQGLATQVVVASAGDLNVQETIRAGLALGADSGVHIQADPLLEPLNIAKLLAALVTHMQIDCVIAGKQSIDGDNNQVGQMLAALLNWPQATYACDITIDPNDKTQVQVKREIDGGVKTVKLGLPAVITTDLRLNQPRYPTLPNIMKARQKPITTLTAQDLRVTIKQHIQQLSLRAPVQRKSGVRVNSAAALVERLRQDMGVPL